MNKIDMERELSPREAGALFIGETHRNGKAVRIEQPLISPKEPTDEDLPETQPTLPLFALQIPLPPSLRALGHRNFRYFWTGQLFSLVGTWMQMIARGWLVLELTHSPFWLGMVGFANAFPVLLLSLWGGVIADRFPKRSLIIFTQATSMIFSFVLAALTLSGMVEVWHVIGVSLALGTVFAFDAPARQAFTVDLVGKADLMNAVALNSSIFNGARVLGPAIGAIVLAWQGAGMAFLLNGISYLAVLYGLSKMNVPNVERKQDEGKSKGQIMEGLRYVRHHETISVLMLLISVVSIFAFPYSTLMPIFADSVLRVGQGGYGMLMAFAGIGSLVGALSLTFQSGKNNVKRGRIILLGAVGLPLFLGTFSLSLNYLLSLAMLAGVGWTMISINATINTIIQTNVPDELRGRVNGVFAFLFIGVAPLGQLQTGLVADHFGAPVALAVGAVVTSIVVIYILLRKRYVFDLI